ncbi:GIY-YIG nuclease family protein [Ichthyenterobacterium magnum]|uniref:Putative endonuclease n=1 Tax=Ichthyenterobacterium magnum TaxID=1230530 RepID=A0A420DVZ2_9FLAO|nr:GIY-YIG nuclease family protein [Ichthyenterobacterium magnum]RKE98394.1 putative endonuclease [Ichthyenterobacterium magnum]
MIKNVHQYYLYLLTSKKIGTLYIGVTYDLERRVFEHKNKLTKGFTSKYDVTNLVYFEIFGHIKDAIKREKQFKKWNRKWKIELIEKENKNWIDLTEKWYD